MLNLPIGVVQGVRKIIQVWLQMRAQSGEQRMLARFSVIVKQLLGEVRSAIPDEVALCSNIGLDVVMDARGVGRQLVSNIQTLASE